jgi:hypothetical protein
VPLGFISVMLVHAAILWVSLSPAYAPRQLSARPAVAAYQASAHESGPEAHAPTPAPTPEPTPKPDRSPGTAAKPSSRSFAVYVLSRAKGVPPEAREALRRVREMVEADRNRGLAVRVQTTRIGIEGETRLCAEYDDPKDAAQAIERASALVKGVDLTNLVVEPCEKSEGKGGGRL